MAIATVEYTLAAGTLDAYTVELLELKLGVCPHRRADEVPAGGGMSILAAGPP